LHGRYPGLIEIALQRCPKGDARSWLDRASEAFERERLYVVRLTSAVGPLPSTPGAAETEASIQAARHALETLATSERKGCALGAATALVGDWWPIRRLLDRAPARVGLECPAPSLRDEASVIEVIGRASDTPASERALAFGGEQLLLQHRALLDLLEARCEARGDYSAASASSGCCSDCSHVTAVFSSITAGAEACFGFGNSRRDNSTRAPSTR